MVYRYIILPSLQIQNIEIANSLLERAERRVPAHGVAMKTGKSIGIIGAGIGGLTAAIALRNRGFHVTVFEQASHLREVGAGLTLSPNASLVLEALGLKEQLESLDGPTPHLGTLDYRTGRILDFDERDLSAYRSRYGALTRQVHRADLHNVLSGAVDRDVVQLGHKLADIVERADGVDLTFENGRTAQFDAVIGCDGLKSVVRERLFAKEPALFTGFVAWRGLVKASGAALPDMVPHFGVYPSPDKLFIRYPVRGGALINYVAIARKADFHSESWNVKAEVSDVEAEFAGWHEDVTDLIRSTPKDSCMCWAIYTRQPLDRWTSDRVALLGDAAHPMTPFFGMGAAMAIEDAYILARCFEADDNDWPHALKRYESARMERGNHMQRISLARADDYMSRSKAHRNQKPGAGLGDSMDYNPLTAPI